MAEENVQNNRGNGNLEPIKAQLKADFNLDQYEHFAEAVFEIEKVKGPLSDDQAQALGELLGEMPQAVSLVMDCIRDPEVCEATKSLLDCMDKLDAENEGAGLEFLKGLRDWAHEKNAGQEVESRAKN
jgi:hypothetical protein